MKNILVPTDFSKNASNAYKYAIKLAEFFKSRITLLHVYETPVLYTSMPMATQLDYGVIVQAANDRMKKFFAKHAKESSKVGVELMLQQGLPSARITETALEKKSDLIVVGRTGTSAVERFFIGSNTSRVINNAPCPVLAIPPNFKYNGMKKIVFATDLTADNLSYAKQIVTFASLFKSDLIFLYVDSKMKVMDDGFLEGMTRKIRQHVKYSKISGYVSTDVNVSKGINFFLKKYKADCLVMLTHHRKFYQVLWNRSITSAEAFHTSIPLLALPAKDELF